MERCCKKYGFSRFATVSTWLLMLFFASLSTLAAARISSPRINAPSKYGPDGPPPTVVPDDPEPVFQKPLEGAYDDDEGFVPRTRMLAQKGVTSPSQANTRSDTGVGALSGKAQDKKGGANGSKDPKKKAAASTEPAELLTMTQTPIEIRTFTSQETKAICYRYEGKLVAFYTDVYMIEKCKRRLISESKTVYDLVEKGHKVVDVDRDVIIALPEGESYDMPSRNVNLANLCRQIEKRYITYSYVDVYYVVGCRKHLFPDWTTYTTHRSKRGGDPKGTIEALEVEEFAAIPEGEPIPSVVDEMFSKLLSGEAGIEVIPVDEACKGVNNQLRSFYSRLYKIEKCYKRELVGIHGIFKVSDYQSQKVEELSAEKWLSLPDGVPLQIKGSDRFDQSQGPPRIKRSGT